MDVLSLQEESRRVLIEEKLVDYLIQVVHKTRNHPEIALGVSPRGSGALFRAAQSLALIEGRSFALPDDIKRLVEPVFAHRLMMVRTSGRPRTDARTVLREILEQTAVPA